MKPNDSSRSHSIKAPKNSSISASLDTLASNLDTITDDANYGSTVYGPK